ncbi:hypothetical protein BABINDRAFT_168747 [Babjeviella inositovora NRRL Y-12698]|uniref:LicD/FKTN/FKRP nucleotidyltransferase domain-containing protein n=1 Tax=Babjeviella inositovora NRRL Y-12698 TaxID=984486 RepID=A0A1E3QJA6_9ASCO|nr:uncharacterized protein BABINDRAFT_168747 [Babjeviella inositovora NRRL Y-12698]ODQ77786.1 hypothetical protein BABINDRAFT_168747 [Babjeviella inositovora NRRL Y-12698]
MLKHRLLSRGECRASIFKVTVHWSIRNIKRCKITHLTCLVLTLYYLYLCSHKLHSLGAKGEDPDAHLGTTAEVSSRDYTLLTKRVNWGTVTDIKAESLEPLITQLLNERDTTGKEWLYNSEIGHKNIVIPDFYQPKSKSKNPIMQSYDPRFTLGIYLHYINKQLLSPQRKRGSAFSQRKGPEITIPFHWLEWVDLSALGDYLSLPLEKKPTCVDVRGTLSHNKYRESIGLETLEKPAPDILFLENRVFAKDLSLEVDERYRKVVEMILLSLNCYRPETRKGGVVPPEFTPGFQIQGNIFIRNMPSLVSLHGKTYLFASAPSPSQIVMLAGNLAIVVGIDPTKTDPMLFDHAIVEDYIADQNKSSDKVVAKTVKSIGNFVDVKSEILKFKAVMKGKPSSALPFKKSVPQKSFQQECYQHDFGRISKLPPKARTPLESSYYSAIQRSLEVQEENAVPKYFSEANTPTISHYDWRFYDREISDRNEQRIIMHHMVRTWLKFTGEFGLTTWIAHGSLLSWYWNGKTFPWDIDIDVQMPLADLHTMALKFNQSLIMGLDEDFSSYFLDIGTYITERIHGNGTNNIDARLIHTGSGMFIDITGVALTETAAVKNMYTPYMMQEFLNLNLPGSYDFNDDSDPAVALETNTKLQVYNDRNYHMLFHKDISPLRMTIFEGTPAYIPCNFLAVLNNEYDGATTPTYLDIMYQPKIREWVDMWKLHLKNQDRGKDLNTVDLLRDARYEDVFIEALATYDATRLHEHEMKQIDVNELEVEQLIMANQRMKPSRSDLFAYRESQAGRWAQDAVQLELVYSVQE